MDTSAASIYLGVDMAKASFQAALVKAGDVEELGTFANTAPGYAQLAQALAPQAGPIHLIVEATSTYHLALVSFAYAQGWQVSLPNPQLVSEWAKGRGRRAKTDAVDARVLAQFGAECRPRPQQPLPEAVRILEQLLRRKQDMEQMLHQEHNRQGQLHEPAEALTASLERLGQALQEELAALDAAIQAHLEAHPELKQQRGQLLQVPGIGQRNVLPLLVLLYRWEAHTAGQGSAKGLTAYVGLDPVHHTSGQSVYKRPAISKMGNADWRRRLYLSALGGTRARHSPLSHFYHRLLARHKPKKVALIACARKILIWALAIFRSGDSFVPARAFPS
jgi:transposase